MSRSNELKTGLWRIYCSKRGKLPGLGYSYPPKPSPRFEELDRGPFWILLIYIEVIVGWRQLGVRIVQVRFNVVRGSIAPGRGLAFKFHRSRCRILF
jgi:hypothetical protein